MSNRIVIAGVVLGVLASACLVSRRVHLSQRTSGPRNIWQATKSTVEGTSDHVSRAAEVWPAS